MHHWVTFFTNPPTDPLPSIHYIPVFKTKYYELHLNSSDFDALIVTSKRSLQALTSSLQDWIHLPIYCVGPSTADCAFQMGFRDIRGRESGHAAELFKCIHQDEQDTHRHFAYFVGDKVRDTLASLLTQHSMSFQTHLAYETLPMDSLEIPWMPLSLNIWAFFSPSGFDVVLPYLKEHEHEWTPILAAIGPTTAAHIQSLGYTVQCQAHVPSVAGMHGCIQNYVNSIQKENIHCIKS